MTIPLTGKDERVMEPYQSFEGRVIDTMPVLLREGYNPASVADIINRRQYASYNVRGEWKSNYFFTGDSAAMNQSGAIVLTLDSPILRTLTSESALINGALTIGDEFIALRESKDSLFLTPEDVAEAHQKGYSLDNGRFVPANKVVAKVWDHLSRGSDLQSYAQMISEATTSKKVMRLYFDQTKQCTPTVRSLVVNSFDDYSNVIGFNSLNLSNGRLVGKALQLVVSQRLEERIAIAISKGLPFELADGLKYVPVRE